MALRQLIEKLPCYLFDVILDIIIQGDLIRIFESAGCSKAVGQGSKEATWRLQVAATTSHLLFYLLLECAHDGSQYVLGDLMNAFGRMQLTNAC